MKIGRFEAFSATMMYFGISVVILCIWKDIQGDKMPPDMITNGVLLAVGGFISWWLSRR